MMRALDLFCGAGGATKGLQRAGFHVTGVDIKPQPRYCGDAFIQGDVLGQPLELLDFDFVWASPPCQAFTIAGCNQRRDGTVYPDLVDATRKLLSKLGRPWVIENVPGAPVRADLILCGSQFGLPIARHRLFELSWQHFSLMPQCDHAEDLITICGHGTPSWMRKRRIAKGLHPNASVAVKKEALGINWMNRGELSQSIPPAYSEFIARAWLTQRQRVAAE
jgi:DNA (cytosine-5)-methyltransferase 1